MTALLVVEVAGSSLPFDRGQKLALYARCRVPEYWIVNLREQRLEVYRSPQGERYADVQVLTAGDTVGPLAAGGRVGVAEVLP